MNNLTVSCATKDLIEQIAILLQEIISTVKSNDNDSYWPEETQQPPP
ncbi:4823_t:CDS:1, partial [Racocetra fulgida]